MKISSPLITLFGLYALGRTAAIPSTVVDLDNAQVGNETDDAVMTASKLLGLQGVGVQDGNVPFQLCSPSSKSTNAFKVEGVNLNPNPPVKNGNVNITVSGHLKEKLEKGAKMKATILAHGFVAKVLEFDFCEGIAGPGCPVEPGPISFSFVQWLDKKIPTFLKYTIRVEFLTAQKKVIACALVKTKVKKPSVAASSSSEVSRHRRQDPTSVGAGVTRRAIDVDAGSGSSNSDKPQHKRPLRALRYYHNEPPQASWRTFHRGHPTARMVCLWLSFGLVVGIFSFVVTRLRRRRYHDEQDSFDLERMLVPVDVLLERQLRSGVRSVYPRARIARGL